jgi:hypothetical protein
MATLLDYKSEVRNKYSPEIIISGLFNDKLTEIDWILTLSELELVYGFEIPDELFDRTDLTLGEYAYELSQLPVIPEVLYEEFFDIKFTSMKLTKRYIELENNNDADSFLEMKRINEKFEELDNRLNVLLGNILVN